VSASERTETLADLEQFRPALLRWARYLSQDPTLAEDLVQATMLSAIEHFGQWQGRGPLKHWLMRILTNQHRREGRHREATVDEATWEHLATDAGWAADTALLRQERIEVLQQALLGLPEADREVLLLRDLEGIEGAEAAEMLGLSLPALKSKLHRARLRLLAAVREGPSHSLPHAPETAMSCMEVLQCLGDYVEGALAPSVVAALDAHLVDCRRCRLFSRRYADLLDHLARV
jgi:RNA polymerase sigma-70 factor (ECF subfamily)